MKRKAKKVTMIMYVLAVLLLAGCGKEESSREFSEEEAGTRAETGRIEEEIPAEELSAEEKKTQSEAEPDQNALQDTAEGGAAQSVPEENGEGTGQKAELMHLMPLRVINLRFSMWTRTEMRN